MHGGHGAGEGGERGEEGRSGSVKEKRKEKKGLQKRDPPSMCKSNRHESNWTNT